MKIVGNTVGAVQTNDKKLFKLNRSKPVKIIGNTVGTTTPKPNLMQTDPTKGDYVKGKEDFVEKFGSGEGITSDGLELVDKTTGKSYHLYVDNGELTME